MNWTLLGIFILFYMLGGLLVYMAWPTCEREERGYNCHGINCNCRYGKKLRKKMKA